MNQHVAAKRAYEKKARAKAKRERELQAVKDTKCPNVKNHTKCPTAYNHWNYWANRMRKTHKQIKCPDCGRFAIWVPRKDIE